MAGAPSLQQQLDNALAALHAAQQQSLTQRQDLEAALKAERATWEQERARWKHEQEQLRKQNLALTHKLDQLGAEWQARVDRGKLKQKNLEEDGQRQLQRLKDAVKKERKAKQDSTRELQALKRAREQQLKEVQRDAEEQVRAVTATLNETQERLKEAHQRLEVVQRDARALTVQLNAAGARTSQAEAELELQRHENARMAADLRAVQAQAAQALSPDAVRHDLLEGAHITTLSQAQLHELQMQLGRLFTTRIPEELTKRKEAEVKEAELAKRKEAELKQAEAGQGAPLCVVCLDGPCSMLFLPCRHMKTCAPRSAALVMCPMCRAPIQDKFSPF